MKQADREFISSQNQTAIRTQTDNDASFYVDNYGGLNTTSPSVNLPFTDSNALLNMRVSLSGTLLKRSGSFVRKSITAQPRGTLITTFTLDTEQILLILKVGTSLYIYLAPNKESKTEATLVKVFTNVFPSAASTDRPSFVWTTEERPRLIMVSKNSVPIELEIMEVTMTGDGDNTIAVPGNYTTNWASTNTFCVHSSNTVLTTSSITHLSGTTTFTFSSSISSGTTVSVIQLGWHWWAEAIKRQANEVYASTFRFNTSINADANVEIPEGVRRGLEADSKTLSSLLSYGDKCASVYQTNAVGASTFTYDNTPTTATQFAFSNKVYTAGADNITPGTSYLTFGAIAGTGTNPPTPVHIIRNTYLPFNGGEKIVTNDIDVVDSTGFTWEVRLNATQILNTTSNKYFWVLDDTFAVETTGTDLNRVISFGGGVPYGIDTDFVEIINSQPNTSFVGSSAVATYYSPKVEGTYRPWYGASLYANYKTGVFPTVIGLYQDRLVLAGFSSAPMTILFSNTGKDGSRWGYQDFQVDFDDTTLATNPVELILDGVTDDVITNVVTWFNSLFVLTKRSTRRVHGGDNIAVSPTNNFQNNISSVGCYSNNGVVRTDRNVVFVSNSGLYAIDILEQTGDYYTKNIGIKVEDYFFKNTTYPTLSWVFYNQLDDEVWIGISDGDDPYVANRLLILFNKREAFSEYALVNGYFPCVGGTSDGVRKFLSVVARDTDVTALPSTSSQLLLTEFDLDNLHTDLTYAPTYAQILAGSTSYSFHTRVETTVTNNSQRLWSTTPSKCPSSYTLHGFRVIPLADYDDNVKVRQYNGVSWSTLDYSTEDFTIVYQSNSYNIINIPFNTGDKLEFTLLNDDGVMPIHVIRDNFALTPTTDFTISEQGDFIKVTLVLSGDSDSTYLVGQTIPCWHFTPSFFRQLNPLLKRGVHYVGYYSNKRYSDYYRYSDVNTSAGQDSSEIVDTFKSQVGIKLGVLYNDSRSGVYESEVYGSQDLIWDEAVFDFPSTGYRNQLNESARVTVPLIGVGYSFQCVNFNYSLDRFEIIGYHVLTRRKGRNSSYWY